MLAGVSADYYVRLEQGRDRHPSDQVLEALSRVLDLGPDGLEHARRLAGATPAPRRVRRPAKVAPGLLRLIDAMSETPVVIADPHLDVLASNLMARALNPAFGVGHNLVRAMFLEPGARGFYLEWERHALETVASLRAGTAGLVAET